MIPENVDPVIIIARFKVHTYLDLSLEKKDKYIFIVVVTTMVSAMHKTYS